MKTTQIAKTLFGWTLFLAAIGLTGCASSRSQSLELRDPQARGTMAVESGGEGSAPALRVALGRGVHGVRGALSGELTWEDEEATYSAIVVLQIPKLGDAPRWIAETFDEALIDPSDPSTYVQIHTLPVDARGVAHLSLEREGRLGLDLIEAR